MDVSVIYLPTYYWLYYSIIVCYIAPNKVSEKTLQLLLLQEEEYKIQDTKKNDLPISNEGQVGANNNNNNAE